MGLGIINKYMPLSDLVGELVIIKNDAPHDLFLDGQYPVIDQLLVWHVQYVSRKIVKYVPPSASIRFVNVIVKDRTWLEDFLNNSR